MSRDLMRSAEIKERVREAYRQAAPSALDVVCRIYDEDQLSAVPRRAVERSLGVANHMRHAPIRPGDHVLDIGCGGGIDTVLAARATGETGRVYALDFLPEMLKRAAEAVDEAGLSNVTFVEGDMEAMPLPDDSVDVVVSNGVINLAPRKARVFAEIARVLRPGGRLCVSDLSIIEEELPPAVLVHPAAWAG